MTKAYHFAHDMIKKHVHAGSNDVIIHAGFGMTAAVNKFQRILGLKVPESCYPLKCEKGSQRPVVFITHMEHHSNQTSWLATIADVEVIQADKNGLVNFDDLHARLENHKARLFQIGSFPACSNVIGSKPDL